MFAENPPESKALISVSIKAERVRNTFSPEVSTDGFSSDFKGNWTFWFVFLACLLFSVTSAATA